MGAHFRDRSFEKKEKYQSLRAVFQRPFYKTESVPLTLKLTAKVQKRLLKGNVPFPPFATPCQVWSYSSCHPPVRHAPRFKVFSALQRYNQR